MSEHVTRQRGTSLREIVRRRIPLRTYVAGVIVVFIIVGGALLGYARSNDVHNAELIAGQDATYAAKQARATIAKELTQGRIQLQDLAALPTIDSVFRAPARCSLNYASLGAFPLGHLDIIAKSGRVLCTSLHQSTTMSYAGASWLAGALAHPEELASVRDGRTGQEVLLQSVPIAGYGAIVSFLELGPVASNLATLFGESRHSQFMVTTHANSLILSSSIEPARWNNHAVAGTPFATRTSAVVRPDVVGTPRIFGQATLASLGWRIYAGSGLSTALAPANVENQHLLLISLLGLVLLCAATLLLYRRLATPINQISAMVSMAAERQRTTSRVELAPTPREVTELVDRIYELLEVDQLSANMTAQLATVVDSSNAAIFSVAPEGNITSWSAGAARLYGYEAAEILNQPVATLTTTPAQLDQGIVEVVAHNHTQSYEAEHVRRDGTHFDVAVALGPIRNRSGAVEGVSIVIYDVTQRKRNDAERRALEARIVQSQRLESLGQLAGGVAHDFNNLLSVIINYAAFARNALNVLTLNEESANLATIERDVIQISLAAERAAALTHQLLSFARREIVEPQTLSLNVVVSQILPLLERTLSEDIEITVLLDDELASSVIDQGQLEQVIVNLAVNARDAMRDGGTLTIETSNVDVDSVYAAARTGLETGLYVQLRVSDNGAGMSSDCVQRAFEPFFTTKPTGEGTGLGLATVYGIVTQAGGHVSLSSIEGRGTSVTVLLRASSRVPRRRKGDVIETTNFRAKGECVLIVEDEPALLEVSRRVLNQAGYRVLTAPHGPGALEVLDEFEGKLDLLLCDVVMPHMLGTELAEQVVTHHPESLVVFMSGYAETMLDRRGGWNNGVTILRKPFSQIELLDRVAATLRTRSAT